jgi:hypothetical protein
MKALLKLLPEPTQDQTAKRAIDALAALGVDRSKITYEREEFQLSIGTEDRIWLWNLHAECRLLWPWQRGGIARRFMASFLQKAEPPKTLDEALPYLLPGVRDSFMYEVVRLQTKLRGLGSPSTELEPSHRHRIGRHGRPGGLPQLRHADPG